MKMYVATEREIPGLSWLPWLLEDSQAIQKTLTSLALFAEAIGQIMENTPELLSQAYIS
jgi:hypothetical protein